jgi:NitT/TauT family transport system substrate-binding protein
MATGHPVVSVSPNNPVFDLPIYVARDEGLFARAGIEVRFQAKYTQRNPSDKEAFERLKESLFEQGKADVYNLCEWAGIDRSERSSRGAQVLALRPAVGAQAILSFDAEFRWESTSAPARTTPPCRASRARWRARTSSWSISAFPRTATRR